MALQMNPRPTCMLSRASLSLSRDTAQQQQETGSPRTYPSIVSLLGITTLNISGKNLKEIPEELKNLDAAKAQEICDLISNDFDKSDTTDQIIVKALEVAIKLFDLYLYVKKV